MAEISEETCPNCQGNSILLDLTLPIATLTCQTCFHSWPIIPTNKTTPILIHKCPVVSNPLVKYYNANTIGKNLKAGWFIQAIQPDTDGYFAYYFEVYFCPHCGKNLENIPEPKLIAPKICSRYDKLEI